MRDHLVSEASLAVGGPSDHQVSRARRGKVALRVLQALALEEMMENQALQGSPVTRGLRGQRAWMENQVFQGSMDRKVWWDLEGGMEGQVARDGLGHLEMQGRPEREAAMGKTELQDVKDPKGRKAVKGPRGLQEPPASPLSEGHQENQDRPA